MLLHRCERKPSDTSKPFARPGLAKLRISVRRDAPWVSEIVASVCVSRCGADESARAFPNFARQKPLSALCSRRIQLQHRDLTIVRHLHLRDFEHGLDGGRSGAG
jgi:hypothetical protein